MRKGRKISYLVTAMILAIQVMFLGGCEKKLDTSNSELHKQENLNKEKEEQENNSELDVNKDKSIENKSKKEENVESSKSSNDSTGSTSNNPNVKGEVKIHYIDVGQADSILIQQGSHSMLIDAGNNDDSKLVKDYIKKQGITTLDYVIGTHPHEDHIGGLDYVIKSFNIGNVLMPKKTATTKTYRDVLTAVKEKGLGITQPQVGQTYNLGEAKLTIMGPFTIYDNANDCSIVVKLNFGNNSFLFTGDAEGTAEMAMVNANLDLKSDVLKVGHHGSKTSTVSEFLNTVNPKYAVVSVGKNNEYNHPTESVMNRLKSKNIKLFRTDEQGTIIVTSNGKEIKFNKSPGSYKGYKSSGSKSKNNSSVSKTSNGTSKTSTNKSVPKSTTNVNKSIVTSEKKVWISATGKKYHSINNCGKMNPKKAKQITLEEAKKQGMEPCSKCN